MGPLAEMDIAIHLGRADVPAETLRKIAVGVEREGRGIRVVADMGPHPGGGLYEIKSTGMVLRPGHEAFARGVVEAEIAKYPGEIPAG